MVKNTTMPPPPHLVQWWADVNRRTKSPVLIIVCVNSVDAEFATFRADLPAQFRNVLVSGNDSYTGHLMPPVLGKPGVWFGAFTNTLESSIASFHALWATSSSMMRVVFVPPIAEGIDQLEVAKSFAKSAPNRAIFTHGWPSGGFATLQQAIDDATNVKLPAIVEGFNAIHPCDRHRCVVLAGVQTHKLWSSIRGASDGRVEHITLADLVTTHLTRWHFFTKDLTLLIIETSVSQSLDTSLYNSGLQGSLRSIIDDARRTFNIVVLVGDNDIGYFRRIGATIGRFNAWYVFVLPEDVNPYAEVAASSAAQPTPKRHCVGAPPGAMELLRSIGQPNEQERVKQVEYQVQLAQRFALGRC
jgi:hypothetical protein